MKKAIAMLLAGVMTLSLTACSGNTVSETNSGTGENNAAGSTAAVQESTASQGGEGGEAENGEVVEITVQSWQYALGNYKGFTEDDELTQAIADEFNATHPGIHALKVDFAAGSAPDVIGIAPGADLEQYKSQLAPLADYASQDLGEDWQDKFTEASFTTIKLSGDEIYAFPSAMSAAGTVWYNNKLMTENGVESFPATWEELRHRHCVVQDRFRLCSAEKTTGRIMICSLPLWQPSTRISVTEFLPWKMNGRKAMWLKPLIIIRSCLQMELFRTEPFLQLCIMKVIPSGRMMMEIQQSR